MAKIISVDFITKEKRNMDTQKIQDLKEQLQQNKIPIKTNMDIYQLANNVRDICSDYTGNSDVPVISIAKNLGLRVCKAQLQKNDSGYIFAGGTTYNLYQSNEVIFVSKKHPLFHQRFIVAHEIAHFLLDYLPDEKYQDKNLLFQEKYGETPHNSDKELRADYFAAELLMPKTLFIKLYNEYMNISKDREITVMCLSTYFKVKVSSIEKRIKEVLYQ